MTGLFKQKNSGNILVLLIYGLILKFGMLLHPMAPLRQPDDHFLYIWLLDFLAPLHFPPIIYTLIAFFLLYSQAIMFNRICNDHKMMARTNYLAGMSYMLITSLFIEWNHFSAPLLINSLLIWIFHRVSILYNSNKPGAAIFNVGLIMGIVTLMYQPAIVFSLFLLMSLFIMRPLRVREWLIGLLGITTPYYFLAIVLYLSNQWDWKKLQPNISFNLPAMPSSIIVLVSITLLILPFIIGGFFVQNNLTKMLIQVRKSWSLLLVFLIVSMLIIVANGGNNYVNWLLCAVPLTAFHAAAYFYPSGRIFPLVMHWIIFGWAMYIGYWTQ
ncbi:hypothetical protein HB364_00165 [Pseudoflavitalea sp. X16]|uniref:DUF6427 family protein n=1 Tax=Paraflavitalea devenefica TaxID=2716334 RepID=UPI001420EAE6|nr:DUF6427 family protein [Paraflavitalea devenefica]NII23472.1 hypothetical protein [Paraflavitalea devenefica]